LFANWKESLVQCQKAGFSGEVQKKIQTVQKDDHLVGKIINDVARCYGVEIREHKGGKDERGEKKGEKTEG